METPEGHSRRSWPGPGRRPRARRTAGGIDDGSAGTPVVKGDLYAAEGHGLFLVQHLAAQWGYLRDAAGTTVWFHLPADEPQQAPEPARPRTASRVKRPSGPDHILWAAAIRPALGG